MNVQKTNQSAASDAKSLWNAHKPQAELKAYLDGELNGLRQWVAKRHLSHCESCQKEVSALQRLGEEFRDLEKATPRPELRARILASLPEAPPSALHSAERTRQPQSPASWMRTPQLAFGSAALALLIVGASAAHYFGSSTKPPIIPVPPPQVAQVTRKPVLLEAPAHPIRSASTVPSPDMSEYTDPVSKAAEQLTRKQLTKEAVEAARKPHTAKENPATKPALPSVPTQLAMDVRDMRLATETLHEWAVQLGGSANDPTALPKTTGEKIDPTPGIASATSRALTKPNEGMVVAMHIPADRAPVLYRSLSQLGVFKRLPTPPTAPTHSFTGKNTTPRPTPQKKDDAADILTSPAKSNAEKNPSGFVTITLHLQASPVSH